MAERNGTIILTPDEVCLAAYHAVQRRRAKLIGERQDREQLQPSSWDNEVEGGCAELALCKYHSIYWTGLSGLRARDGGREEVRWTRHDDGGLIVYQKDRDDARIVLLEGTAPVFHIVGWLHARDGKHQHFKTKAGYFLVPRKFLRTYEVKSC